MKNEQLKAPAFPPVPMQDNFGRFVSIMPGLSKLEFIAALMLPTAIQFEQRFGKIQRDGKTVTSYDAAQYWATELINHLNPEVKDENTLQIIE
jgi:hypothetical protein